MVDQIPEPPGDLTAKGRQFWDSIVRDFDGLEQNHLQLLFLACKQLDTVHSCERKLHPKGKFLTNRAGNPVQHPALKASRDAALAFVRIVREIGWTSRFRKRESI